MPRKSEVVSPDEKRRFTAAVRKALRELDYQQFQCLAYWEGANEHSREVFRINSQHLLSSLTNRRLPKITLKLNPGYPLTPFGGLTLKPTHVLDIWHKENVSSLYSVGVKDGRLYISVPRRQTPQIQFDAETKKRFEAFHEAARQLAKQPEKS